MFEAWVRDALRGIDASHDIVHAQNVAVLAERIAAEERFPDDVRRACRLTALAHDVCDRKYVGEGKMRKVETVLEALATERATVRELVRAVLPLISYSLRVQQGIPSLHADALKVYHAVSDADMLEAMGATGVLRTFIFQATRQGATAEALAYVEGPLMQCKKYLYHPWA